MKNRVSPTFIAAGVVIGLSCFILLSMLFYDTVDYYERSDDVAAADGFRFSVANTFFKSLGVGAYFGWMVILGWGIVIFFREKVGDLALRGASLVVVIVSGAAMAALLGADQHGGSLGVAVGNILSAGLGSTFGAIIMIAIFGASFLYATDYGFFRYVRQAREAVAVMEVETEDEVEVEEDRPTDWSKLIDQTVDEVTEVAPEETPAGIDEEMEEELLAERPDEEETDPEDITSEDSGVIVTNFQAIETEDLDEDLLVSGESEEPVVVTTKPLVEIEEEADDALLTDEEPAESPAEETTSEVLLDEDLLLSDEVAETAREMLAAFETSAAPVVEETEEPEEEPVEEPEPVAEPVDEEDEEEIPVATVEIVEEETESDEDVEILEAEPVEEEIAEEADEEPEAAVEETEESAEPVPGDVHSVFDALLGFPPRAEEEPAEPTNLRETPGSEAPREEPSNGQMRSSSAAAPVAEVAPVEKEEAPVADEVIEEPGFILTDDVIVVESEVPEAETEAEAPTPVAEKPIVEEPVAREEIEREVVEEMQAEEFTG
ncbi:MAG: DNA translocase FtsK 4TM domain-containing protein, partial [Planctomycetota bacterium]